MGDSSLFSPLTFVKITGFHNNLNPGDIVTQADMRRQSSLDKLRDLLLAPHSTSMRLPLLRQRGHDIRPRAERCYPKAIRRIVFGWKRGESGEKHRTRLCCSDCVCPSRASSTFSTRSAVAIPVLHRKRRKSPALHNEPDTLS